MDLNSLFYGLKISNWVEIGLAVFIVAATAFALAWCKKKIRRLDGAVGLITVDRREEPEDPPDGD